MKLVECFAAICDVFALKLQDGVGLTLAQIAGSTFV